MFFKLLLFSKAVDPDRCEAPYSIQTVDGTKTILTLDSTVNIVPQPFYYFNKKSFLSRLLVPTRYKYLKLKYSTPRQRFFSNLIQKAIPSYAEVVFNYHCKI